MTKSIIDGVVCLLMSFLLFVNLTTIGPDNEQQQLNKIRNSRGKLIKTGEDNGQV